VPELKLVQVAPGDVVMNFRMLTCMPNGVSITLNTIGAAVMVRTERVVQTDEPDAERSRKTDRFQLMRVGW